MLYKNVYFIALGDPLIKGLTEVANLRPNDPVGFLANYLHTFATENHKPKTSTVKPKREETKEEVSQPIKAKPIQNHIVSNNHNLHSAKKIFMAKEKSVDNFIDDNHEDYDATPGMDERG